MHYLVIPWRESDEEISCLRSAVASNEWKRRIPSTLMVKAAQGQLKEEISKLPLSAVAIVYCTAETTRDRDVATLCEGAASGAAVRASIAVPDDSASKWVVVERRPADVRRAGRSRSVFTGDRAAALVDRAAALSMSGPEAEDEVEE
jgi:hypothetical protein